MKERTGQIIKLMDYVSSLGQLHLKNKTNREVIIMCEFTTTQKELNRCFGDKVKGKWISYKVGSNGLLRWFEPIKSLNDNPLPEDLF